MRSRKFQTPKRHAISKPQPPTPAAKKYNIITTKTEYYTREWELEEYMSECNKEEAEALASDEPMLEIPKWTEKEFTGVYAAEGVENLSDSAFDKRHAKLEHDEKRRKKWDVQRIREQKTIERLKRRHCKDELAEQLADHQEFQSFYPSPDQIKFIEITEDLPVLAFGDGIPDISTAEFNLPWVNKNSINVEMQLGSDPDHLPTSFVFLKKRKRHHSTLSNKKLARIRLDPATIAANAITASSPATTVTQNPVMTYTSPITTTTSTFIEIPVPPPE